MMGLARMVWAAAIYRTTDLSWERSVEVAALSEPVDRHRVQQNPIAAQISAEYHRIFDDLPISRVLGSAE